MQERTQALLISARSWVWSALDLIWVSLTNHHGPNNEEIPDLPETTLLESEKSSSSILNPARQAYIYKSCRNSLWSICHPLKWSAQQGNCMLLAPHLLAWFLNSLEKRRWTQLSMYIVRRYTWISFVFSQPVCSLKILSTSRLSFWRTELHARHHAIDCLTSGGSMSMSQPSFSEWEAWQNQKTLEALWINFTDSAFEKPVI